MLKGINHFWWRLYFSAYWSAYNWGEKVNPKSNATNLLSLMILIVVSGLLQIGLLFGIKLSALLFVGFCGLPAFIIPYWTITRNKMYGENLKSFEYLRNKEFASKRNFYVVSVFVLAVVFNAGIAIIRNVTNSL